MKNYKIAILAPFPPLIGGMVQLAESLYENIIKDNHKVYRLQLGSGIDGIIPFPYLYFQFIKIIII